MDNVKEKIVWGRAHPRREYVRIVALVDAVAIQVGHVGPPTSPDMMGEFRIESEFVMPTEMAYDMSSALAIAANEADHMTEPCSCGAEDLEE